jgi:hypothetical protein
MKRHTLRTPKRSTGPLMSESTAMLITLACAFVIGALVIL